MSDWEPVSIIITHCENCRPNRKRLRLNQVKKDEVAVLTPDIGPAGNVRGYHVAVILDRFVDWDGARNCNIAEEARKKPVAGVCPGCQIYRDLYYCNTTGVRRCRWCKGRMARDAQRGLGALFG